MRPIDSKRQAAALALAVVLALPARSQWTETGAPESGPVWALDVSPHFPGALAAGAGSNVFTYNESNYFSIRVVRSGNAGVSWNDVTLPMSLGAPTGSFVQAQLRFDPLEPTVLWLANVGLAKSTDLGRTWAYQSTVPGVTRLAFDPLDPLRVYATAYGAFNSLFTSSDGGGTWNLLPFTVFSSMDDLAVIGQGNPGTLLLATGSGLMRSTDGGASFTTTLGSHAAYRLAPAGGASSVVWGLFPGKVSTQADAVGRSLDGGLTWSLLPGPCQDMAAIAAHPTDPLRAWISCAASGILRTLDGGQSWIPSDGAVVAAHVTTLVPSPGDPDTLFAGGVGGQGGVWRSRDGGATWWPANAGLSTTVPELSFDGLGRVYAIGLGLPVRRGVAGAPWRVLHDPVTPSGTAVSLAVPRSAPDTIVWVSSAPAALPKTQIRKSADGGLTWTSATPPGSAGKSVRSVVFDTEGTLYAPAGSVLFRSADLGASWTSSSAPAGTDTIVPHPSDPSVLHGLTILGDYVRSDDGGATWTEHGPEVGDWRHLDELKVSRLDPDRLALLANRDLAYTPKTVFHSQDGGTTWTRGGLGLPDGYLLSLDLDPHVLGRVVVGTGTGGVYLSVDHGATFAPWNAGIEDQTVRSVRFDPLSPGSVWTSTNDGRLRTARLP